MTLGERLLMVRRRRRLTQRALATAAGLSPNTIAGLEQGIIHDLGGEALAALARALGTSTDFLVGLTDESGVDSRTEPTAEGVSVGATLSGSATAPASSGTVA